MYMITKRKTIEIDRKRIPLRNLLHGKEIREAAKNLEQFRLKLNEQEFLYGAKISIQWDNYGDVYAVARRAETDNEFADRMEKARIAAEAKKAREAKKKELAEARARAEEINKRQRVADYNQKVAKEAGISVAILDK